MSARDAAIDQALSSLERWRELQLDDAQLAHSKAKAVVEQNEAAVMKVQHLIDESQALSRQQMEQGSRLSIEALTRLRHFTVAQSDELERTRKILQESRERAVEASGLVIQKFQDVTVVRRLRKRRADASGKALARDDQKRLDDQAMLRVIGRDEQINLERLNKEGREYGD